MKVTLSCLVTESRLRFVSRDSSWMSKKNFGLGCFKPANVWDLTPGLTENLEKIVKTASEVNSPLALSFSWEQADSLIHKKLSKLLELIEQSSAPVAVNLQGLRSEYGLEILADFGFTSVELEPFCFSKYYGEKDFPDFLHALKKFSDTAHQLGISTIISLEGDTLSERFDKKSLDLLESPEDLQETGLIEISRSGIDVVKLQGVFEETYYPDNSLKGWLNFLKRLVEFFNYSCRFSCLGISFPARYYPQRSFFDDPEAKAVKDLVNCGVNLIELPFNEFSLSHLKRIFECLGSVDTAGTFEVFSCKQESDYFKQALGHRED